MLWRSSKSSKINFLKFNSNSNEGERISLEVHQSFVYCTNLFFYGIEFLRFFAKLRVYVPEVLCQNLTPYPYLSASSMFAWTFFTSLHHFWLRKKCKFCRSGKNALVKKKKKNAIELKERKKENLKKELAWRSHTYEKEWQIDVEVSSCWNVFHHLYNLTILLLI